VRKGLPPRFEAVAEALASGSDSVEACHVVGRDLARDGASLEETLEGLRATWRAVRGGDPPYDAISALLVAWSDSTLSYLHQISCEDPMTGLGSLAHVRSRLSELFRADAAGSLSHPLKQSHALVVCELPRAGADGTDGGERLTRGLQMARLGEAVRTVFVGGETVGRLGSHRVVVVACRDDRLGTRVRVLRTLLAGIDLGGPTRVWIEGMPGNDATAALLLDELARL
jgi:hypothetical protein